MQSLQTLIDLLERGRKLHISIHDLSGILSYTETEVARKNVIHSKPICDMAKSTPSGFQACLLNKAKANLKATESGECFCGHCIYGIFEYAMPIVVRGRVAAIVYVGNAIIDPDETLKRIKRTCEETGVSEKKMLELCEGCEKVTSSEELMQTAEIVSDYLKLLYSRRDNEKNEGDFHWLTVVMMHYAEENFSNAISIGDIAILYNRNEKYIGRLFKSELGMSFSEYCNQVRLKKAEKLIRETDKKIIDISTECGFENVTYFNRLFKKKYGVPPSRYNR